MKLDRAFSSTAFPRLENSFRLQKSPGLVEKSKGVLFGEPLLIELLELCRHHTGEEECPRLHFRSPRRTRTGMPRRTGRGCRSTLPSRSRRWQNHRRSGWAVAPAESPSAAPAGLLPVLPPPFAGSPCSAEESKAYDTNCTKMQVTARRPQSP